MSKFYTVKIDFVGSHNQGSWAVDAIAQTIGGDWLAAGCTDNFGTIVNVPEEALNEDGLIDCLEQDDDVEEYRLSEQSGEK